MKPVLAYAALAACALLLNPLTTAQAAKAMNYDCSKAGNANKAACKTAGAPAVLQAALLALPALEQS